MRVFVIIAAFALMASASGNADVPTTMNYQGRLLNSGSNPVPDGLYTLVFTIYDAASGGISRWTETRPVLTTGGLFSVLLGTVNPLNEAVFNPPPCYLGIKVGSDPELTPRVLLGAVPYSERVSTVDGANGGAISGNINIEQSTASGGNILKAGQPFIHNYGTSNAFVGISAGNFSMTGYRNAGIGWGVLRNNTLGKDNTACGYSALYINSQGIENCAFGSIALANNSTGNNNVAIGFGALEQSTTGSSNAACGAFALFANTVGHDNTALGAGALQTDTTGILNTAIGAYADVTTGNLSNATAIGYGALVNASNKIRLGNAFVTVIEGQVAYTYTSDRNEKENFRPVDGNEVLTKIAGMNLTSWNYRNQDPLRFRHYGPVAQEFFAAFGHDAVGQCGDSTTINSGDLSGITLAAVQALEKRTSELESIRIENAALEARVHALETKLNLLLSNK